MNGTFVVIPAFNEAQTIAGVLSAVCAAGPERIIVVDDGSSDATVAAVCNLRVAAGCRSRIELIQHPTNLGKGFALATGIDRALAAGGRRIVTIDGDGQHDGADLPRLEQLSALDATAIVIAARTRDRDAAPPLRRFANDTADFWVSWACGQRIADTQSGFRLYPAELLSRLALRPRRGQGFAFETALLIDGVGAGARVRSVPIATRYESNARASHYRPWRDTWSIIQLVGSRLLRRGLYPRGLLRVLVDNRSKGRSPAAHSTRLRRRPATAQGRPWRSGLARENDHPDHGGDHQR